MSDINEQKAAFEEKKSGDKPEIIDLINTISNDDDNRQKSVPLSDKMVEDSLDRIVRKIFAEKFEGMLVETIEKIVKKEIERIANLLKSVMDGEKK